MDERAAMFEGNLAAGARVARAEATPRRESSSGRRKSSDSPLMLGAVARVGGFGMRAASRIFPHHAIGRDRPSHPSRGARTRGAWVRVWVSKENR